MLKIAQKSDYALLIAVRLAEKGPEGRLSLEELASNEGISQGYLEEVAGLLRAAGIITGRRGAGGGYVLTRPAEAISLASIITATEGGAWATECIGGSSGKPANDGPKATNAKRAGSHQDLWRKVQGQIMTTLHGMTVADVMQAQVSHADTKEPARV
ncbi:MAG: hypothetical protein RLZZ324_1289 [Candidatus Parcubacteria bacterium]